MSYPQLDNVVQEHTGNKGGALKHDAVSLFVVHATAGASFASSVSWLKNPQAKASAHFVVGRNGDCVQLVPLDRVAWHAGKSEWRGKPNVNFFSIGIELDNIGPLAAKPDGSYVAVVNSKPVPSEDVFLGVSGPYKAFQKYTETQLTKLDWLLGELRREFPNVKDVVGHSDVSPGRKFDPYPSFDAKRLTRGA